MPVYELRYGASTISVPIPDSLSFDVLSYKRPDYSPEPSREASTEIIRASLDDPIGTPLLRDAAAGVSRAVILISDGTRACPTPLLLAPLLEELHEAGLADDQIDIVVALGAHRRHTCSEIRGLVGEEVWARGIRIHNHQADEAHCVHIGTTKLGTSLEINRLVAEAPLRIAAGVIQPHGLVGVSGGIKALFPGTGSRRSIEQHHSLSLQYQAQPGCADNPLHQDLEEVQSFLPLHFILNVVVDPDNHVMAATAGHPIEAHRIGAQRAKASFVIPSSRRYDLTIVSPGGHPRDLQLYQAIKSLKNAAAITRPGGTILMAAECPEQFGSGLFQQWTEAHTVFEAAASLRREFKLGPHKLIHLAEILSHAKVELYSSLPDSLVELLGMTPLKNWEEALQKAAFASPGSTAAILPYGAVTFPVVNE